MDVINLTKVCDRRTMKTKDCYKGFPELRSVDEMLDALISDPPECRWQMIREIFRIKEESDRHELIHRLQPQLDKSTDYRVRDRIRLSLMALHKPLEESDYVLVKGKGVCKASELEACQSEKTEMPELMPIVDFHVHPKIPDLKFFADMKDAGITHAVILATDTDPDDINRPEIVEKLKQNYDRSAQSSKTPFEHLLKHIKAGLYSTTHVSNRDVAAWIEDYPDRLIGFGSVNLSKSPEYVAQTLDEIARLNLRGIKLLPYSQFFNPASNENMDQMFEYCRRTKSIILSHCGCGPGPFEILELSQDSHPQHWDQKLSKFPDVPVVLAHAGAYSTHIPGIWLYETLKMGSRHKNLYVDISAVSWIIERENVIGEIRKTIGFDRVLFATDYPLPLAAGSSLTYLVSGIKANTWLTEKEKQKVLGGNAQRLLNL